MDELVGRTVGPYVLEELIGEGAFAGVFLSTHHVLGRPFRQVALKLSRRTGMTAETVGELFADAFLLAETMNKVTDAETRQHLVHVYDAGISDLDGRAYLTMEHVPGTTLAARFARQKKIDAAQLTKWITQIARALRALHEQDLVHRDLKPDNVLLGMDNTVRLVDFGLTGRLVDTGHVPGVAGTFTYMAPETVRGVSVPASDVYSLGLLMFEGLTGEHPFRELVPPADLPDDKHGEWLYKAKENKPAGLPSGLNNTVKPALDAIVSRCLAFQLDERYQNATELLDALGRKDAPEPKSAKALRKLKEKRSAPNLGAARKALEDDLASGTVSGRALFDLLQELARTLVALGEHAEAANRLSQAWRMTESSGLLRDTAARVALLTAVATAYRLAGNEFQARRYETVRERESGGRR
jgi:eukaryotic-like serine/threonine-protein kinase